MRQWLRILSLSLVLVLLTCGLSDRSAAAAESMEIVKTRCINGAGKVFIPQIRGMTNLQTQSMLNANIKNAIFTLNNSAPGSSLNGDFTVSFYNQNLLGIHFTGYSFTQGTAHPHKIDQGIHIDLATGPIYTLADLFVAGADYMSRIKELCNIHRDRYRLQIDGLWHGWTHEEFIGSWQGPDAAFLLSDQEVRVYAIPRYATGAISGYGVPYADLMDIIDQQSVLWRKMMDKPSAAISVSSDHVIDKAR